MKNKRILITGGAGFIGSELVRQAADTGAEVTIVDNLVNGKADNVSAVLGPRVSLEVVDIRDTTSMTRLMRGVDMVFHLACLGVRHSLHSPLENHDVNATATLHLLRIARDQAVGRFVYVSSSEVYGTARYAPMGEDHPTFPMTVYGASKLAGECYTRAYYRAYNYPTTIIRPFNAFGPRSHHEGDSGEVIPKFILRCMAGMPMLVFGDGNQTRDFTFVEDTARGIFAAGFAQNTIGETINIGSGKEITVAQLADLVKEVLGRPDATVRHETDRPGDVLRLCADTAHARALFGFEPKVSLDDGLSRLRDWYIASGTSPKDLLAAELPRNWECELAGQATGTTLSDQRNVRI